MKRLAFGLLVLSVPAGACSMWWPSVALGAGAQFSDIMSSRGLEELNPILGRRQTFGRRQALVKAGAYAGITSAVWLGTRRDERACRVASYIQVGTAGLTVGVSVRNWRLR